MTPEWREAIRNQHAKGYPIALISRLTKYTEVQVARELLR